MLGAFHCDIGSQHIAEHLQFRSAETLAGGGGRADGAMILQQQKASPIGAPFGHVAFARADLRQSCDTRAQRTRTVQRVTVSSPRLLFARAYHLFERRLAEGRANGIDQADGKFGMGIREAIVRGRSEMPATRGPADAALLGHGAHQALVRQSDQVLSRRFRGCAERGRDVGGAKRAAPFDQAQDPVGRAILQAHACIMRRFGVPRKRAVSS
jgi:hypothetical protein